MTKKCKSYGVPIDQIRIGLLKDSKRAKIAVEVALEEFEKDNDVEALLNTVRLVAKAQGGLAKLARKASVSRQALHEALSPKGNPRLRTFQNVLSGLGLRMTVKPATGKSGQALAMAKLF
jgi:probable addiction module antidote protein